MKFAKRITALLVVAVMLVSSCMFVNAATFSVKVNGTYTVDTGVSYSKLNITSGVNGNNVACVAMEFDPADGYFPMVFAPYAGSANLLEDYYSVATTKYGYDVAGIINGSFFDMASENLIGLNISNGRISCAHTGYSGEVVAFGTDGSMNIVTSCLDYKLFVKGKEVPNALRYINKRYENDKYAPEKIFYYDTSCGNIADTNVAGYEVVCQKVNNTDLIVGGTLFGKVVSVGTNTYGTKFESNANIESDKFVLFVKNGSSYAQYLQNLKAGDDVAIAVSETNASAKEVMENANSVITSVGWLVKNGVDRTRIDSWIGAEDHTVTLDRGWTAFGQKADGSYIFFTSTDGSAGSKKCITMRDVADYMISKGCINVIRMDGGGSCAMYLKKTSAGSKGYAQYSSRAVTDGIMVVKKSSAVDSSLVTALNNAIANAKASVAVTPSATLSAAIKEAEALVAAGNVVSGDARAMISKLSGKNELMDLANTVSSISYQDYSEKTLATIRTNYDKALELYFAGDATAAQIQSASAALANGYNNTLVKVISKGKSYTTTAPNRGSGNVHNDDTIRLTNGLKCYAGASTNAYSGWNKVDPVITVDLGSNMSSNVYTVYACSMKSWGIPAPTGIKVEVSTNGSTWTNVGSSTEVIYRQNDGIAGDSKTNYYSFTVKADSLKSARYVRFTVDAGNHVWIDEVEVGRTNSSAGTAISNAIYINGINSAVAAGDCHVFTPSFGTITGGTANHNYTTNVILTATGTANKYTVKSIAFQNGGAPDIKLASNEILLACHTDATVPGSVPNQALVAQLKSGDTLYVYGVNAAEGVLSVAAYASATAPANDDTTPDPDPIKPVVPVGTNLALDKTYTVTGVYSTDGVNADYPDENGITMTDGVTAAVDGTYADTAFLGFNKGTEAYETDGYATITVDLGAEYYMDKFVAKVASSLNSAAGIKAPADVSVYVSNDNKNWEKAGSVVPTDSTTVSTVDAVIQLETGVWGRYVQYRFVTDVNWIMVAEVEAYAGDASAGLGDVNASGKVDSVDYLLVKRACFNTYSLSADEKTRADVNRDNSIDSVDYVLIKRIVFGTYAG